MINAICAKECSSNRQVSQTELLMIDIEKHILESCQLGLMWCLVPVCTYSTQARINVHHMLVNTCGFSVSQRSNSDGVCFYIKWGHAHDSVSEDK